MQNTAELAYPIENRPRQDKDLESVLYHIYAIDVSPCVIVKRNNEYIFLDGVHRVVAANILGLKLIPVFQLTLENC